MLIVQLRSYAIGENVSPSGVGMWSELIHPEPDQRCRHPYPCKVSVPILSTRALNRALLARQLLLERSSEPMITAIERIGGLQTQYAPSGYVGLWSRLQDFPRESLTGALEDRRVVQATLMRQTIHMVSAGDFRLMSAGVRQARRANWLRAAAHHLADTNMEQVTGLIREFLAGRPRRLAEIKAFFGSHGVAPIAVSGMGLWVDLVRVPPSGTWNQRRADLFGLAEEWLGARPATPDEGLDHLVQRYLGGFGPASLKDIAGWAGVPAGELRSAVERVGVRRFVDEQGGQLYDVEDGPLPDPDTPAPVRFLPTWDATLLVHARRTQILPEVYRPRVFDVKTPHSVPTFLVDGSVAGTWKYERGQVSLDPFRPLPASIRQELEKEARALAAFHTG